MIGRISNYIASVKGYLRDLTQAEFFLLGFIIFISATCLFLMLIG